MSKNKFLSWIVREMTKTDRIKEERFTRDELIELFKKYNVNKIIDTKRDLIGIFKINNSLDNVSDVR
jgi:hypothetical protein